MRRRGHSGAGERCRCGRGLSVTGNRQRSASRAWRLGTESNVEWNVLAAAMVTGSDNPPTLKTELFVVAPVTVTLAPVAVRLPDAVALEPSTTLPNGRVPGLTDNCPTVVVPVPEIGIVKLGLDASELP